MVRMKTVSQGGLWRALLLTVLSLVGVAPASAGQFHEQAEISPSSERFTGYSVALSAKGEGAVWVFVRKSLARWTQQAKLTGAGEIGSGLFGWSVALSADGKTALIGGIRDNGFQGAAWVFIRAGSTWTEQAKLTGGGESGEGQFGSSVALSGDGSTAIVGGPSDDRLTYNEPPYYKGAAWVFARSGAMWTQQGEKLTGPPIPCQQYGKRVALTRDGDTVAVSIDGDCDHSGPGGAALFVRAGSTWTEREQVRLPPREEEEERSEGFGDQLAYSSNGRTLLIAGATAVWAFTRSGMSWMQQQPLPTCQVGGCEGLALSAGGSTALVGATVYVSRHSHHQ